MNSLTSQGINALRAILSTFSILLLRKLRVAEVPIGSQSDGQLLFHLVSKLYEQTSIIVTTR